jgi:hypothetical protein
VPETASKRIPPGRNALCVVAAEALFILLPFIVIAIVFSCNGQFSKVLYMPEWAIAASILIGLSLTRFTSGLLQGDAEAAAYSWERVMLIFTLVIVFAFVPSLLILSLVLVSEVPSHSLATAQIVLFLLGLFLSVALGWTGQQFMQDANKETRNAELQVINGSRAAGE